MHTATRIQHIKRNGAGIKNGFFLALQDKAISVTTNTALNNISGTVG